MAIADKAGTLTGIEAVAMTTEVDGIDPDEESFGVVGLITFPEI